MKRSIALCLALLCCGAVERTRPPHLAAGSLAAAPFAYFPGSRLEVDPQGIGAYALSASGAATIEHGRVLLGSGASATVIAAGRNGLAMHTYAIASPPTPDRTFIAVASYDDGIVIHAADAPFAVRGVLGIGGAAAGVAIGPNGAIASADTDGSAATIATLRPWNVKAIEGVPDADELAYDGASGDLFVTNRDIDGAGAVTRIAPDGTVARRLLGLTCEGLAIDERRGLIYVANTNDGSISVVDARTLVEVRRFHAIDRVFSLALSPDGSRLYAVSNQSLDSPFARAGGVTAFDLEHGDRRIATSPALRFPLGIALDESEHRIFVTDESEDSVDVLDARTLQPQRAPLHTCDTPWQPTLDDGRLYVPCARSNQIDVFDARTLRRIAGAPFATGGYPLAVAVHHA